MRRRAILLVLLVVFAAALVWLLRPPAPVRAGPWIPTEKYDDAVVRLASFLGRDTLQLYDGCSTLALLAGERTPRVFVLLHGITNCPLQFRVLAESLRAGGDNVLVPRVPHHGLEDRMTTDLANLRAEELADLVLECTGIARGLGDTVVVCGLSMGGVTTAWAVAHAPGVDRAVLVSPAFAPDFGPGWLAPMWTRLALHLPNSFRWWDERKKEALPGPTQCYPRFPTRAIGETYRLGEDAMARLARRAPYARDIAVIRSEADKAVSATAPHAFALRCAHEGVRVREYVFAAPDSVPHDMIDPDQVDQRIDVAYSVLLRFLRGQATPAGSATAGDQPVRTATRGG